MLILNNKSISFDYDARGRRIKKIDQTSNDLVEYFYDNKLLIKEKHANHSLNFMYNENDELIGFEHVLSSNNIGTSKNICDSQFDGA